MFELPEGRGFFPHLDTPSGAADTVALGGLGQLVEANAMLGLVD